MGKKDKRRSVVFRIGLTPRVRWKKSDHYYVDAYRFSNCPNMQSREGGFGFRILWLIVALSVLSD